MDTNTPTDSSWWYKMEQLEKPDRMLWYIQPPAMIRSTEPPPPRCKGVFKSGKWYIRNDEAGCRAFGLDGPCENVEHLDDGWDY